MKDLPTKEEQDEHIRLEKEKKMNITTNKGIAAITIIMLIFFLKETL